MAKGKNVLTTGQVAEICQVAPRTVTKWFDSGQLKGYRIAGSPDRRIPISNLIQFMKKNNMPIPPNVVLRAIDKIRILIVGEGGDAIEDLANALTKANYDVRGAQSDFEAGQMCQKFIPHVLLVNFSAKNINAIEILKSIRADKDLKDTKIIAVTGKLEGPKSAALLQQGFDACVSDSTDIPEIIGKIREVTTIIV